jgi:plastocyanin
MKSMTKNLGGLLILMGAFLSVCLLSVSAHGTGGTIEVEQDGYLIDVGYSEEEIVTGLPIQLSFLLFDLGDGTQRTDVEFTDVWVRIENDAGIVFASLLSRPEFGDTSMSYFFTESGDYELFVRYKDMQDTLVERTVMLNVSDGVPGEATPTGEYAASDLALVSVLSTILTLIIFAGVFLVLRKRLSLETFWPRPTKSTANAKSPKEPSVPAPVVKAAATDVDSSQSEVKRKTAPIVRTALTALVVALITFFIASMFFGTIELPQWPQSNAPQLSQETSTSARRNAAPASEIVSIVLTETGYEPQNITIEQGTTISFTTTTGRPHWPASNLHPTHDEYSEFDPMEPVPADESWSFTFDKAGDWTFHDHLRAYFTGEIVVVPKR